MEEERPSPSTEPLLLLLNAPSKSILLHLLDDVWRSRKQGLTPVARASLQQQLHISADSEVDALVASILGLLRKLVYKPLNEEEIQSMFPKDFHSQLGRLLVQLLSKGQHIWREEAIQSQVSLPRLLEMTWDVKNDNAISEIAKDIAAPRAVFNLKVKDYNTHNNSEQDVKFQVTREQLNVMLESLHNVRDQLANVSF